MLAPPRSHVDAAPMYPVCDPSARVMLDAETPVRAWTQVRPGNGGGSLARDITILRRGLDGHVQRRQRERAIMNRRRLWIACSGLGLGFLCGVASLFF